jgi:hypothetical protein
MMIGCKVAALIDPKHIHGVAFFSKLQSITTALSKFMSG